MARDPTSQLNNLIDFARNMVNALHTPDVYTAHDADNVQGDILLTRNVVFVYEYFLLVYLIERIIDNVQTQQQPPQNAVLYIATKLYAAVHTQVFRRLAVFPFTSNAIRIVLRDALRNAGEQYEYDTPTLYAMTIDDIEELDLSIINGTNSFFIRNLQQQERNQRNVLISDVPNEQTTDAVSLEEFKPGDTYILCANDHAFLYTTIVLNCQTQIAQHQPRPLKCYTCPLCRNALRPILIRIPTRHTMRPRNT